MTKQISKAAEERALAKKQLQSGGLSERETYTAKQVATRCGTDSKTMRKFFRSSRSTVDPVGQGGRYEFDARDFPKIKSEFDSWQDQIKARKTEPGVVTIGRVMEIAKTIYLESIEEDPEPTEEELAELEDEELDITEDYEDED